MTMIAVKESWEKVFSDSKLIHFHFDKVAQFYQLCLQHFKWFQIILDTFISCPHHILIKLSPYFYLDWNEIPIFILIFCLIFLFRIILMDILRHFHFPVKASPKPISSTNFILNWSRSFHLDQLSQNFLKIYDLILHKCAFPRDLRSWINKPSWIFTISDPLESIFYSAIQLLNSIFSKFSKIVSNLCSIFSIIDSGITAAPKFTSSWRELYRQIAFELLHFLQLCSTIPSSSRFITKWWSGPRSISLVCIAMNCPNLCQSTSISNSLSDISNVTILASQDFKCYENSAICWCFAISFFCAISWRSFNSFNQSLSFLSKGNSSWDKISVFWCRPFVLVQMCFV